MAVEVLLVRIFHSVYYLLLLLDRCVSWAVVVQSLSHVWLFMAPDPMECSMPDFPVLYHLLELAQAHVHWVSFAIQQFHPLLPPSPPVLNLSQHQGLFQWVSSLHQVAKGLQLQLQQQSFSILGYIPAKVLAKLKFVPHRYCRHIFQENLTMQGSLMGCKKKFYQIYCLFGVISLVFGLP